MFFSSDILSRLLIVLVTGLCGVSRVTFANEAPTADDLLNWPMEGQITDAKIIQSLQSSSLVDLSYCPQLQSENQNSELAAQPDVEFSAPPPIVLFCIPKGSRGRAWNQLEPTDREIGVVELVPGQILRLLNFNEDTSEVSGKHRLHTNGGLPCHHQPGQLHPLLRDEHGAIVEISYYDCRVSNTPMDPLDERGQPRLYDHFDGRRLAPFYVRVSDDLSPSLVEP